MAKVVLVDNLDRESVADELLKDGISHEEAKQLANDYNDAHSDTWSYFAVVKEDDYRLWRGMAELV